MDFFFSFFIWAVVYQKAIGMNMRLAALSPKTFAVPKTSAENSSRIADLVANGVGWHV